MKIVTAETLKRNNHRMILDAENVNNAEFNYCEAFKFIFEFVSGENN